MSDVTIPEDVQNAAELALGSPDIRVPRSVYAATADRVARAILAERERCAKIADEGIFDEHALAQATEQGMGYHNAATTIAQAIRTSHE